MDYASYNMNNSDSNPLLRNPFADNAPSRVTASRFTNTAIESDNSTIPGMCIEDLKAIEKETRKNEMRRNRRDSVILNVTDKIEALNIRKGGTVLPDDSVSQLGSSKQIYTQSVNTTSDCLYNDVIGGYAQTADEKLDELDAIAQIQKVSGLPHIFVNSRLNFLIHLHKPLQAMLSKDNSYPHEESFYILSDFMARYKGKDRDPHRELLYQVVKTTIKGNRVRANPFNLPLLEVGMYLNEKLIYISFMQLYQEFQIEWFKSMKNIEAPKFHNKFKEFKPSHTDRSSHRPRERRHKSSGSVISAFGF